MNAAPHTGKLTAICLVLSRGAKGLDDTPEVSLARQVKMPKSQGRDSNQLFQGQRTEKEEKQIVFTCQHGAAGDIKHMHKLSALE